MKTIYLIRHSSPFIEFNNYKDYQNVDWNEYNKNMILSVEGEENAKKLCNIDCLLNIDAVYASNSFRAIGTAKYIAEANNLNITIDDRINERNMGINKISDLPEDYNSKSLIDKNYKLDRGESLNELDQRVEEFMNEILESSDRNIALFIQGMLLLSFLQNISDINLDNDRLRVIYNNKLIYDNKMTTPMIFKITYDNNKVIDINNITI
jgi:2,3-bisphosphoglycerate-dependent phosphoglycerate mutase